jgi:MscS family membrane protein
MNEPVQEVSNFFFHRGWILPVAIIFMGAFIFHFIIHRVKKRIIPKIEKTHLAWDSALLKAVTTPFKVLVWILAVTFSIEIMGYHFENETFSPAVREFRAFFIIILFAWTLLRFIKNMEIYYVRGQRKVKKQYDKTTVRAICQVSRIAILILALLVYLETRHINLSAVLAFGGAGGIVVGLAAKDLLSNFFGGLMIYLDRPFSVGDWICSPDREIEGTVETIGWRLTRIRTFSQRPLYVPNGIFSNISVENPSRMSNRHIKTHIGIRYDDAAKIESIVQEAEEMLKNNSEIDQNMSTMVRFDEFGPSSLNFLVYCFTKATERPEYLQVQQEIYLNIIKIIEKHGAQCAFPTTTLHIPQPMQLHPSSKPIES